MASLCEIMLDMIVFWRLAGPSIQKLRDGRRAMPSSFLAAEKVSVGLGGFLAVGFIAILIVVLQNVRR